MKPRITRYCLSHVSTLLFCIGLWDRTCIDS